MGATKITESQVIALYNMAFRAAAPPAWVSAVSRYFKSNNASEDYAWLGQSPAMREWVGGRQATGVSEFEMQIKNKHFEATQRIPVELLNRDKTGQISMLLSKLSNRVQTHWATLLSDLIINGDTLSCYDGTTFFATDHEEGDSGAQSNKINVDISELPVLTAGTTTNPAVAQMQLAIGKGIQQLLSFVDDQGEPMNESATNFMVMVPTALMHIAYQALGTTIEVAETQTAMTSLKSRFGFELPVINNRLTMEGWTDKFILFRTDPGAMSFICQEEVMPQIDYIGRGTELEFREYVHEFGINTWRNVGYGFWQNACLITLT